MRKYKKQAFAWTSKDKGTWTSIWSPLKTALNPLQTNVCKQIARPSAKMGWSAYMPGFEELAESEMTRLTRLQLDGRRDDIETRDTQGPNFLTDLALTRSNRLRPNTTRVDLVESRPPRVGPELRLEKFKSKKENWKISPGQRASISRHCRQWASISPSISRRCCLEPRSLPLIFLSYDEVTLSLISPSPLAPISLALRFLAPISLPLLSPRALISPSVPSTSLDLAHLQKEGGERGEERERGPVRLWSKRVSGWEKERVRLRSERVREREWAGETKKESEWDREREIYRDREW